MKVPVKVLHALNNNPQKEYLDTLKLDLLKTVLLDADEKYYSEEHNKQSDISDTTYDVLKEYVESKDVDFVRRNLGHQNMSSKGKVKLPVHMGSMDKKKVISHPLKNVIITDKLDGVSCLIHLKPNMVPKLYTRGNGEYGRDVSYLMRYFNHLNVEITDDAELMVRGELILERGVFAKYRCDESNPRNTVAGFVNSKIPEDKFKNHIDFVAYEVIRPSGLTPREQLDLMTKRKFKVVNNIYLESADHNMISSLLNERKEKSRYEIDGIIVTKNTKYEHVTSGNPKHAFAYKENNFHVTTTVVRVEWNLSKDGYLKPLVYFEPRVINNVRIEKATGHNAKFIVSNKIGKGSVIVIERSGDVIPKIVSVQVSTEPDMPTNRRYKWNGTDTDIMLDDEQDNEINSKQFEHMLISLKFEHLGKGIIPKLYKNNVTSLLDLYRLTKDDLLKIDGFKDKSAEKLYKSIQNRRKELRCVDYMIASNVFGRGLGEKNILKIIEKYDPIRSSPTVDDIIAIDGIGSVYAKQYVNSLPMFRAFLQMNELTCGSETNVKPEESKKKSDTMSNMNFVFTGFRDSALEECVRENGGVVSTSISKKTTHLVCKALDDNNTKQQKAQSMGISIITRESFEKKYCS